MSSENLLEIEIERLNELVASGSGTFWARVRKSKLTVGVLAIGTICMQVRELPEELSSTTLDAAAILQPRAEPKHVRLIAIDEDEYRSAYQGRSPLDPAKFSRLLDEVASGRPDVMVVDYDTSHEMFRSMKAPVGVPLVWTVGNRTGSSAPFEPASALGGRVLPSGSMAALDLIPLDSRGMVRAYVQQFPMNNGGLIPSLEFAANETYRNRLHTRRKTERGEGERLLDFRYEFFPMTAAEVHAKASLPGWPRGELAGMIAVVGGTFKAARDSHATPVGLKSGLEIVGQGIEAEVDNTGIPKANPWFAGLLEFLCGFAMLLLYKKVSLRWALIGSLCLLPALSMAASLILFHRLAVWGAMLPVLLSILIAELYTRASLYLTLCQKFNEGRKSEKTSDPEAGTKSNAASNT